MNIGYAIESKISTEKKNIFSFRNAQGKTYAKYAGYAQELLEVLRFPSKSNAISN